MSDLDGMVQRMLDSGICLPAATESFWNAA